MGYLFLITALVFNAAANILMKIGSGNLSYLTEYGLIKGLMKNYILVIGLGLFAVNVVFYTMALSKINLSIAYPIMTAGGIFIIVLISTLFLKESLSAGQMIGLLFLLVGIILVTTKA
ncbi:EamA family transporter [Candidatus Peregrinibacteria bacterium]|jgi:multidrug transporter EmrE-like cation transporter|nr:EamA family transporter [Candidatus Peregrinibacteria bacterium]